MAPSRGRPSAVGDGARKLRQRAAGGVRVCAASCCSRVGAFCVVYVFAIVAAGVAAIAAEQRGDVRMVRWDGTELRNTDLSATRNEWLFKPPQPLRG